MLEKLSTVSFQYPWVLLLLLMVPVLGYYRWRHRRAWYPVLSLPTLSLLKEMRSLRGWVIERLWLLRLLALVLSLVALARPRQSFKEEKVSADGIDMVLTLDISVSMLTKDFQPDRLELSKRLAIEFVEKRPYDRFAVVSFSGEAVTACPLTSDHRVVTEQLAGLRTGILTDGTAIGMGLATAVNRIRNSEAKSKVIILLTDGVNNAGYINPMTATELARSFGIRVHTIAVGTQGEALTPVGRSSDGRYVFGLAKVEMDEELLKAIAEQTGGKFFRASNELALQRIYEEIDRMEKTRIEVTTYLRYADLFHIFVAVALLLLVLEAVIRYLLLRPVP